MNKLISVSIIFFTIFLASCHKPDQESTIDMDLQQKAEKVLRTVIAKSKADSALVLVMSVKTGEVKAVVKLTKSDSLNYAAVYSESSVDTPHEPGSIFIPFSFMAAMEEGNVSLNDSLDTGCGIYQTPSSIIFKDNTSNKGGYGKISISQCITLPSNIGAIKTIERIFNNDSKKLAARLNKMSIDQQVKLNSHFINKSENTETGSYIDGFSIGYGILMTPLQILTCYNAIANNGKMMKAVFNSGEDSVINSQICSAKTISAIQQVFREKCDKLFQYNDMQNKNNIAGMSGTSQMSKDSIVYDSKYFCSYFPSNNPECTCLVIFYRKRNISENLIVQKSILKIVNQLAGDMKAKK